MISKISAPALIFGVALFATPLMAQDINVAIDAAIKSEPKFLAFSLNSDMQKSRLKGVKADAKPSLGLQGSYGAANADFGLGYKEIYPRSLAIAWEMRLFDGGQSLAKINAEDFALAATNAEIVNSRNQLIVETAEAYSNYYVAQKSLEFAKDNLDANARYDRDAKLQFEAGETAVSEKAFADASYARAKALYAQIDGQKQMASANLYRLTGMNFENTSLDGAIVQIPASISMAKEAAQEKNPLLIAANARLAQAQAQYKIANSSYAPKVTLSARATTIRDQFLAGYRADDYGAYVNVTMPLYSYGRISSGIDAAKIGKQQAQFGINATMRGVEMGITQAYANFNAALAQKDAAISAQDASTIALKSVEAEMRVGQRPLKDVLEARRDLTMANMELAKAQAALIVAKYKIIAAVGQ